VSFDRYENLMMWYQQGNQPRHRRWSSCSVRSSTGFWPAKWVAEPMRKARCRTCGCAFTGCVTPTAQANPCSRGCTPSGTVYEATVIESDIASHRARLELMYCLSSHYRTMGLATCRHSTNLWRLLRPYPKRREVVKMLKVEDLTWRKRPMPRLLPWAP
jgi:hypothetical protein